MRLELYKFAKKIQAAISVDKIAPQPHAEMCDFLEDLIAPLLKAPWHGTTQRKKLLLVPRGCFKTTIGSVLMCIFIIKKNPNVRILISSHTVAASVEILTAIKSVIESDWFIDTYGSWRKEERDDDESERSKLWRADSITVVQRTRRGLREGTITCTGVDQSKVGGHYDFILADDIADDKNTVSEKLRAKTRRHHGGFIPILNPGGVQLLIGTRWHMQDIYDEIIREDEKREKRGEPPQYEKLIRSIWLPDGRPYFPTEYPPAAIERLKADCTDQEFSVWYLNEAIEEGMRIFPRANMRMFEGSFYIDALGRAVADVAVL